MREVVPARGKESVCYGADVTQLGSRREAQRDWDGEPRVLARTLGCQNIITRQGAARAILKTEK